MKKRFNTVQQNLPEPKSKDRRSNYTGPSYGQLIWGIMLALAGVGVFIRVPQVMPQIETFKTLASASVFIRLSFYLIGVILIGGGAKKISEQISYLKKDSSENRDRSPEDGTEQDS